MDRASRVRLIDWKSVDCSKSSVRSRCPVHLFVTPRKQVPPTSGPGSTTSAGIDIPTADKHHLEHIDHPEPVQNPSISKQTTPSKSTSHCSTAVGRLDMSVYTPNERSSFTNSYSWKSRSTVLTSEFERMQRKVRHFAPEQFRNPAKPGTGPCHIVPTSVLDYVEHSKDVLQMVTEQMEKNLAARKEAQRVKEIDRDGERQKPLESHFGKNAKLYPDCFGPVLCQPTMWSEEHENFHIKLSAWPTQAELQECGDKRENNQIATRCGRYLPPPRDTILVPQHGPFRVDRDKMVEIHVIKRFLPLDEHGPIFQNGPSPVEVTQANGTLDNDHTFEARARELLGSDLMKEIGDWKAPFVPDWLAERRQQEAFEQAQRRPLAIGPPMMTMIPRLPHF